MKFAIMQPYIFPYIGYFQLISAVDRFVVYDDVTFIKQGWINRNRILAIDSALLFSIPLSGASSSVLIKDVRINRANYPFWRNKFFKTLDQCYSKASQYDKVLPMIQNALTENPEFIGALAVRSLKAVCDFIGITTALIESSSIYGNNHLKSQERIIDICRKEMADIYINPIGGAQLYSRDIFRSNGITLSFLKPRNVIYAQYNKAFVPWLSIIDVLMFNPPDIVQQILCQYDLE